MPKKPWLRIVVSSRVFWPRDPLYSERLDRLWPRLLIFLKAITRAAVTVALQASMARKGPSLGPTHGS
jgi:hypothetical protein